MRGRPRARGVGARDARARRGDLRRLRAHPRGARGRRRPRRAACTRCRRASTSTSSCSQDARRGARRRCSTRRARDPPNPGNANERLPDEGNAERLAAFLAGDGPTVVYFGKLIEQQGRAAAARGDARRSTRALVIVGFGDYRGAELEAHAPPERHALHRPARAPPPRAPAAARRRRPSCRRSSPRRSGWSPPRPPRPAARRSSRATPASPRSPPGSRRSTRSACGTSRRSTSGDVADLRAKLEALLALSRDGPRRARARPRGAPSSSAGRGRSVAERLLAAGLTGAATLPRWARSRSVSWQELLATSRAAFEGGTDFTLAVEEEFALLDPETLELDRPLRGPLRGGARDRPRAEHSSAS